MVPDAFCPERLRSHPELGSSTWALPSSAFSAISAQLCPAVPQLCPTLPSSAPVLPHFCPAPPSSAPPLPRLDPAVPQLCPSHWPQSTPASGALIPSPAEEEGTRWSGRRCKHNVYPEEGPDRGVSRSAQGPPLPTPAPAPRTRCPCPAACILGWGVFGSGEVPGGRIGEAQGLVPEASRGRRGDVTAGV